MPPPSACKRHPLYTESPGSSAALVAMLGRAADPQTSLSRLRRAEAPLAESPHSVHRRAHAERAIFSDQQLSLQTKARGHSFHTPLSPPEPLLAQIPTACL